MSVATWPVAGHARGQPSDVTMAIAGVRLAELAAMDRPRERIWQRGVDTIGDEELLALVVGTGVRDRPARVLAADLVKSSGGVVSLSRASPRG